MWVKGCAFAFSCSGAGLLTVDLFVVAAAVLLSLVISSSLVFFFKSLWKVTLTPLSEMRVGDGYLYYFFFFF